MQFLASLEHSAFGTWVREAPTIWAYPTVLFLHTVDLAFLVGITVSGVALLIADATTKLANPVFGVKMCFIMLGVINMAWYKKQLFSDPEALARNPVSSRAKRVAIVSLVLWIGATTAGRLMGYLGPVSGLE